MSFTEPFLIWFGVIFGLPLSFVVLGWWVGWRREQKRAGRVRPDAPKPLQVALTAAGCFIAALVLAVILDRGSGSPSDTTPPTRSTEQERAGLSESASLWTPAPLPDRKAKRRHERQRSRQSPAWSAAVPRDRVAAFGSNAYLDGVIADQATATARQNERISEQFDSGVAIDATRSTENLDRMYQETATEIQEMCEPWCLDSPRDDYP